MQNKSYFSKYVHYSIYLISAFLFAFFLDVSMSDDGLRHIAFAENKDIMISWGDVFPHSLFSSYDPWFMWHKFLEVLLILVPYEHVHIVVNGLSLFILLILIDIHFRDRIKYDLSSLTYIIVLSIMFISFHRYTMVRPDLLSGLYILGMLLSKNKFMFTFILTLFYSPFYYLFFMYTGSMGLVYMVKKDWKSFFGTFTASVFVLIGFLYVDFEGYVETVIYVLTDQSLRMGLEVSEGLALFSVLNKIEYFILLPIFMIVSLYIIKRYYNYFLKNTNALFLIITSILWVNQARYYDLFLPLIILLICDLIMNSNKKKSLYTIRKYYVIIKQYVGYSKKAFLFYIIAIPYSIAAFTFVFSTKSSNDNLYNEDFFKQEIFNDKIILLNRMSTDIYKALYFNPKIKTVPSCGIGWFDNSDEEMKDIYIRMQKERGISEDELRKLIKYVNAEIYIHYLKNSKQVLDIKKLESYGIEMKMILNNKLIFFIDKNKI